MADKTKKTGDKIKTPRERFLSVGATRVSKAIAAIRRIKPIASRKSYEYSEAEWVKARNAIAAEVEAVDAAFKAALAGKTTEGGKAAFSFTAP